MGLFDKVKKGMLDGTKAIKEISSDVTEMTKLKVALSKDTAKLEELYYNVGKLVYAAYEENPKMESLSDAVITALVDIHHTRQRIKENKYRIELLKGIIKCHQCGYEADEDAKFCSNCGSKLQAPVIEEIVVEKTIPEDMENDQPIQDVEEFEEIKSE